jgi:hypothetical protein
VDVGHAKQIFEDADVFPSILVARKPPAADANDKAAKPKTTRLCSNPREQLRIDDLSRQIAEQGSDLPLDQLSSAAWQLEPGGVSALLAKLKTNLQRLQGFIDLDSDGFLAEVKKIRGKKNPLSAAAVKSLLDEFAGTVEPAQTLAREATDLERAVSDLVNDAYGLTPADIDLLWATAPPRMPIARRPTT